MSQDKKKAQEETSEKSNEKSKIEELVEEALESLEPTIPYNEPILGGGERFKDFNIYWKATGWTFGMLRKYEDSLGATVLTRLLIERIAGWKIDDIHGKPVPFEPWIKDVKGNVTDKFNVELLDEVDPLVVAWMTAGWRWAYNVAGSTPPKD